VTQNGKSIPLQDWKQQVEAIKERESYVLQQEQVEEAVNLEYQASRLRACVRNSSYHGESRGRLI